MTSRSPSGPNPNAVTSNTVVSVTTNDQCNLYEDVDINHDQTGQGQSHATTESLKVGNLSHNEVLAALKPNPMYGGVRTSQNDPASTSGNNKTGQGQSQATTESLKVRNLSRNEVLAALKPNPMYGGVGTSQNDPTSTSGNNKTGQGQSHATTETLKLGNLSHDEVLAALKPNPMNAGKGTLQKEIASSRGDDQTRHGQSQAITEFNTNLNTTATVTISGHSQTGEHHIMESLDTKSPQHSTQAAASNSKLNSLYNVVGQYQPITKSNTTDAVVTSGHDHQYEDMDKHYQRWQGQSQAINKNPTTAVTTGHGQQYEDMNQHDQTGQGQCQTTTEHLDARNLSYGSGPTASQLNSLYAN
uniref:Uncharacterized protein n=1 Tax=Branchiostoma floridae TaxID=7739 RepID=C3Z3Y5_BRAFL|eukprot:XP_002596586.1 hypothetical protein BRAFLDRAFT_78515 [Branchiostoma floridae]